MNRRVEAERQVARWLGLPFAHFVHEVWQERRHMARAACGELAAAAQHGAWFDELVLRRRARIDGDQLRLVRGGRSVSEAEWFQLEAPRPLDARDREALRRHLQQGHTVAVQVDDRVGGPVLAPIAALGDCFECMVHAVVYASPPAAQGFSWHHDQDDVFVFQLAGEKRWRLAEAPERWPLHARGYDDESQLHGIESLTLRAGDVLYLPGGVPHCAQAQQGGSVHLTVSTPRVRQFQARAQAFDVASDAELPLFTWDALSWREAQAERLASWAAELAARTAPRPKAPAVERAGSKGHRPCESLPDLLWRQVLEGAC